MPGAAHTACTVEMVNMQRRVDVAVIDEIQMIGDESRWARPWEGSPSAGLRGRGPYSDGTRTAGM